MYRRFVSLFLMIATVTYLPLPAMEQSFSALSLEEEVTAAANLRAENEIHRKELAQKVNSYLELLQKRITILKTRNFSQKTKASLSEILEIYEHNTKTVTTVLSLPSHARVNTSQLSEFCEDINLLMKDVENSEISEKELLTTLIGHGFIAEENDNNNQ